MKNLILASNSPRRKEILSSAGYNFRIIPSNYEESICNEHYSDTLIKKCAYNKALDVFKNNKNSIVIGADTTVVLDNIILGKPKDKKEAYTMLNNLSNRTHFVTTSICIMSEEKSITEIEKTKVTFRELSQKDILTYLETKKPFDKAGSYGIQDENFDFAIKIEGELDNVIGFPLKLFENLIKNI